MVYHLHPGVYNTRTNGKASPYSYADYGTHPVGNLLIFLAIVVRDDDDDVHNERNDGVASHGEAL